MLIAAQHIEPKWLDALKEQHQTNQTNQTTEVVPTEQQPVIDRNDNIYLSAITIFIIIFIIGCLCVLFKK